MEEEEEEKVNGEEEKENGVADHNHKPLTVHGFVFFFFFLFELVAIKSYRSMPH